MNNCFFNDLFLLFKFVNNVEGELHHKVIDHTYTYFSDSNNKRVEKQSYLGFLITKVTKIIKYKFKKMIKYTFFSVVCTLFKLILDT